MHKGQFTLLLLIIICCLSCLLLFQNTTTKFAINIQSSAVFQKMIKVIQQQRENIKYFSSHPKVIFRCPDDEHSPRHASDDLTDIVMTTNDGCGDSSSIDAILIIHTAANHLEQRKLFRKSYGNYNYTKPFRLKVVFLLGSTLDANLQIMLEKENMDFGDTVIGSFLDTYRNLTLKAVMGFRWLTKMCPKVKLLIKMDDDVIFDVRSFFIRYWQKIGDDRKRRSLHCLVWHNVPVNRVGKWKVEKSQFPNSSYHFPYCAGFFVVITPDLIKPIYDLGKRVDFFWIDDVFLYGMVPAVIRGVHFIQLGKNKRYLTESYSELQSCRQREGNDRCSIWAALTYDKSYFDNDNSELMQQESLMRLKNNSFVAMN